MGTSQLDALSDDQVQQLPWYYQVELRPGVSTAGRPHGTLSMNRELLEGVQVPGLSCLDVGAQEAVIPTLLALRGARSVVAYDRLDLSDRIAMVQQAYGVDFDYIHSRQLHQLPAELVERGHDPFDLVVFAGVLYHMIDPLGGLGLVRGLVRQNGLLLVETSAVLSDEMVMHFNNGGRFYPGSNYFQVTTATLDYFLRMLRLQVVDCLSTSATQPGKLLRVSLVCRAVDQPQADPQDNWMGRNWVSNDFRSVSLDYSRLESDLPPVDYRPANPRLVFHEHLGSVDITRTAQRSQPFRARSETSALRMAAMDRACPAG